ncbi:DUF433 domain-containing protein [Acaryochloris sp. IP29b_bin.137]|uniref:DUF433 domain-containing protein n=1 Tax=Acaryochloris sp. IP29b_bin.137 TaxID=2969217 RepID=UPI002616E05D|nr:DUF433 domain-containing protein [Acaryochloris sp. IP29b_bin.137]
MVAKILDRHIAIKPGVVGGKPHIAGHRITVQNIAIWHEHLGKSADQICADFKLKSAEVYAALAYYFDHREEIDQSIEKSNLFIASFHQRTPSVLAKKLSNLRSE